MIWIKNKAVLSLILCASTFQILCPPTFQIIYRYRGGGGGVN